MDRILQKLIYPDTDKLAYHTGLFYKGPVCGLTGEERSLFLAAGIHLDFAAYLNGYSNNKWKRYTNVRGLKLCLEAEGSFIVSLTGYSMKPVTPERTCFLEKEFDLPERQTIVLEYPDTNEEFLAFEITALDKTKICGGAYVGDFAEEDVRNVNLAIATTTCWKEPFIKGNVKKIREHLLETDDEIAEHLYVNVVDNGRTLSPEDIESDHIRLFPNPNTGGSGGYARGMMESLHMEPHITHILLMDDDVMILPESIRRTYMLLTVLKEEYWNSYISGAMLDYNKMYHQHEDVGTVQESGFLLKAKPDYNMTKLKDVIRNNREVPNLKHPYAAWWYCCMPREMVEKNGYPMPFFIRGDDVEYGLRSHTTYLTMSGICVWHMGFANKYNAFMNMYQSLRNLLIAKASSEDFDGCDVFKSLKLCFGARIYEYNYDGAELVLKALEDFLKGPGFLANANGEKILKEYSQLNEKMRPITEFPEAEIRMNWIRKKTRMTVKQTIAYRLTANGQRFIPASKLSKEIGFTSYDGQYTMKDACLRESVLAVNPYEETAIMRHPDREKYKALRKRFKELCKEYDARIGELTHAYHQAKERFVSEAFWRDYLGLDKDTEK